jgi:FdhD protein
MIRFGRIGREGGVGRVERALADETAIAIEANGIGYAVLMASAADLADLATGFALAERLADTAADVIDMDMHRVDAGVLLRLTLSDRCAPRIVERVRHRTSESSCGLCGIESLEQALRPLPVLEPAAPPAAEAVFAALDALPTHQPVQRATGAVHAAAACAADGAIRLVREDVGRHNALDKLVGAMARGEMEWDGGFALVTSRLSFEMVEKAVLACCPTLAAISAPTGLAVERAKAAGLNLIALARADSYLLA